MKNAGGICQDGVATNLSQPRKLLSTAEVAEMTGLAVSTLEKRRLAGQKPRFIKLGARRVGYDPHDVQQWIDEQRRKSTSDDGTALVNAKAGE